MMGCASARCNEQYRCKDAVGEASREHDALQERVLRFVEVKVLRLRSLEVFREVDRGQDAKTK